MPSRGSTARSLVWRLALEWMLRGLSVMLLVLLLWRALHPARPVARSATAGAVTLRDALVAWTRQPPAQAVVRLDSLPAPEERDWMAALRHAGVALVWSGSFQPVALAVTELPDPMGAWQIDAAATSGAQLVFRDGMGSLDSVRVARSGTRLVAPRVVRGVAVRSGGSMASAPLRDSLVLRHLLVEGTASWETRFTVVALQERGWTVDALVHVAPNVDVRVGSPAAPDTAGYAAAIAIDTSAKLIAGAAMRFVRSGGGLVTLHDAASIGPGGDGPVVLEHRASGDVRAARYGAGRVIRVGYPDLWRMRMAGGDSVRDPVERHRDWLARVIASVAYAPRVPIRTPWTDDRAPYADLVARAGAVANPPARDAFTHPASPLALLSNALVGGLLLLSLLGEWLSRRLRGAR